MPASNLCPMRIMAGLLLTEPSLEVKKCQLRADSGDTDNVSVLHPMAGRHDSGRLEGEFSKGLLELGGYTISKGREHISVACASCTSKPAVFLSSPFSLKWRAIPQSAVKGMLL